ncbi:MAG TPA: shikimate dehydrogenase [Dermatophilaceae bacterium]|nr:shikimate dehydrogenase [Dermatophilaceae bacterium]
MAPRESVRRRCAVLGSPIAHSMSPALHRAAYAHLGLDWDYGRYEVDESTLAAFLAGLDSSWRGLSLTMPLKQAVIPYLDEISETARSVAAVNTVLLEPDGSRRGDNTDVPGMVNALRERGVGRVGQGTVLGGGATARSALAVLREVADAATVYVRTPSRAEQLTATAGRLGLNISIRPWGEREGGLAAGVVVVTTTVGATDDLAAVVPDAPGALVDVVYNAGVSPLAAAWAATGAPVVGGLDVLVHQAVVQVELMTGRSVTADVLRAGAGLQSPVSAAKAARHHP